MNITSVDKIPSYYFNSGALNNILNSQKYKNITFDEFKETGSYKFIRDESPIKDEEDFINTLKCLDYWNVDFLPDYVIEFILSYHDGPFILPDTDELGEKSVEDWNNIIFPKIRELIESYKISYYSIQDDNLRERLENFLEQSKKLSCGGNFSSAIDSNDEMHSWGSDTDGQLNGVPKGKFKSVSCGRDFSCAIDLKGNLHCWGNNSYGQLNGVPKGKFKSVSCGEKHLCAIDLEDNLHCWGDNRNGECNSPECKFKLVSCGLYHSFAIDNNDKLHYWGRHHRDVLKYVHDIKFKTLTHGSRNTLVAIDFDGNIHSWGFIEKGNRWCCFEGNYIMVACGDHHFAAIDANGKLHRWNKLAVKIDIPEEIESQKFIKISCGYNFLTAINDHGKLIVLANESLTKVTVPPQILNLKFKSVVCGHFHLSAFDLEGNMYTFMFYLT